MTATDDTEPMRQPPFPGGQDEVEDGDRQDNLGDADTPADLSDPAIDSVPRDDAMDGQPDGDRQLTTESDALDTGLNDSDLGADVAGLTPSRPARRADRDGREGYAGLEPDVAQTGGTGDRATGVTDLRG